MRRLLLGLIILSLVLYALLFWPVPDTGGTGWFLAVTVALVATYFAILRIARRASLFGRDRDILLWLAIGALLARMLVLFGADTATQISPEVYRYVWEGKLVAHGYNPYVLPPESAGGRAMADETFYPRCSQPELSSAHPPLAQFLFVAAYLLHNDSIHGFRLLSVLAELLTLLGLVILAAPVIERRPFWSWSILIYAFSPLVMLEFLLSNHVDILAMPFFVFGLISLRRDYAAPAGILLALTALVKLSALIFVPVILMHFVGRKKLYFLAGLLPPLVLLYVPFLPEAGSSILDNVLEHLLLPGFNSSAYALIELVAPSVESARTIFGALLLAVVAAAAYPLRDRVPQVSRRLFIVAGAYVILTPSLFPWHLVWIMPFLVLFRNVPFLVLTGLTLPAAHALAAGGNLVGAWWIRLLEYGPFYILLLYPMVRKYMPRLPRALRASKRGGPEASNGAVK